MGIKVAGAARATFNCLVAGCLALDHMIVQSMGIVEGVTTNFTIVCYVRFMELHGVALITLIRSGPKYVFQIGFWIENLK